MVLSHSHHNLPRDPALIAAVAEAIDEDAAISAETHRLRDYWFLQISKLRQECNWDEANVAERIWQEFYSACRIWKDSSQASSRVRETA